MGYMHIDNLYKNQEILLFKECFALEKIHGTSAHVSWKEKKTHFFAGGCSHENFLKLFDEAALIKAFESTGLPEVTIFGEAYGGKLQGMSGTYGKELKFIAFDVKVDDNWLAVPQAEDVCKTLGIEFVHYVKISTDLQEIDKQRDAESVQAVRNGMPVGKLREGVVLRPIVEVKKNNGERILAKHKREEFAERQNVPVVADPTKLKALADALAISEEWVTPMRLNHVLDKLGMLPPCGADISKTGDVVKAMAEDVLREGAGEVVDSKEARSAIGRKTAELFKQLIKSVAFGTTQETKSSKLSHIDGDGTLFILDKPVI
jgi:hypothetical protein